MKSNKRNKRKAIKQEEIFRRKQMFKEQSEALYSCLLTNAKEIVTGINFDKLVSTTVFPDSLSV